MKYCSVCSELLPLDKFFKSSKYKDGYGYRCKDCDKEARAKSRNGEGGQGTREGYRRRKLIYNYNLSPDTYDLLLKGQENRCAICKTDNPAGEGIENKRKLSFAVDHDHDTNKVRGLLCNLCNRALGFFKDDPTIVGSAYEYLKIHKH